MRQLEKDYTVVLYDQRGSGKSYDFGKDYSWVKAQNHVEDLISLTEYLEKHLEIEKVILLGHSYGTYIATQAAAQRPELYRAYIGIGQMSDTVQSESFILKKCIAEAENRGDEKTTASLTSLKESISAGERIVPRKYVRKYGFGARKTDDNRDYWTAFLFGTEYNLLDGARMYIASGRYQDALITEALNHPLSEIVTEIQIPVYFLMGRYDGMTSPESAEAYLQMISGEAHKEMVMFDESAHYPQFEEAYEFRQWLLKMLP